MDKYNKLREITKLQGGAPIASSADSAASSRGAMTTDAGKQQSKAASNFGGGIWGAMIASSVKSLEGRKNELDEATTQKEKSDVAYRTLFGGPIADKITKFTQKKSTGAFGVEKVDNSKFGAWYSGKRANQKLKDTYSAGVDRAKQTRLDDINAQTAAMYAKKGIKLKKTKDKEPELRIVNPGIKIHNIGYMTKSWKPGATLAKHGTKLEHKSCGCGSHGDMLEKLDGGTINLIRKTIGMGEGPVTKRFADTILKDAGSEKGIYDFLQKLLKDYPKNQEIVIKVAKEGGNIQPIFKSGGKIKDHRVLTGVYHSQKNNLDLEVTKKGIPVVSFEDGGEVTQHAEVEKNELVLNKEASETIEKTAELIEELPEEKEDEMLLRFGKWLVVQLLKNTENLKAVS